MAVLAELCELPVGQVSKCSSRSDGSFWEWATGRLWPI
jgi:hypothetical protein